MNDSLSYDSTSQFTFNPRRGRNESHPANDRQFSSADPHRQNIMSQSRQSYHARQSMDSMPSEQRAKFPTAHRPTLSPVHQHETLSNIGTTPTLHFEYHTRYPSPPPTEAGFPAPLSANQPPFVYPSPSSAQRSIRDRTPNDRRIGSSPSQRPSPPPNNHTLHRANGSSSSTGSSPMITLPPLSSAPHRPPMHRGVDQAPSHQHVENPAIQRITQLPRDHPEQGPVRRHTLDSNHAPDQQMAPGARKRTLSSLSSPSYPTQLHRRFPIQHGTQQVPPQQGPTTITSYSTPLPTPRRDNPPPPRHDNPLALVISPILSSPSMSQPPQLSPSLSQPATPDESSSPTTEIVSVVEAAGTALEPLRLGFENIWAQTVQNVHQAMNKMQRDLNRLITVERRKNVNLMRCLVTSSEKIRGHDWAMEELRRENGSLMGKALESEQLRRENAQKITLIDTLNQENRVLRRENEELKKKSEEVREALTRAAGFVFQHKEELAKVKADAETFRKSAPSELHRETARLHAERERERIFNDAVKQLRALTALEEDTTRERDSEEAVVVKDCDQDPRIGSCSSSLKQDLSPQSVVAQAHHAINEQPRSPSIKAASTKPRMGVDEPDSREMVEMDDDDDVIIVPPITTIPSPIVKPDPENDAQTFEKMMQQSRNLEEPDAETQRQRQRQARRGPSPLSPLCPPQRLGKPSPMTSKTGMKRHREEYEDGQADAGHDTKTEQPGLERMREDPTPGSKSAETEAVHSDAGNSEESEIVVLEWGLKDDMVPRDKTRHKGKKVSTDGGQVTAQMEIQSVKDAQPKALGRWSYYTHYRDSSASAKLFTTQQQSIFTTPSPPAARLPKKLGINHMDLLYKTEKEVMVCRICLSLEQNPDTSTAERRKAKVNTKKFPLNASWADLINHCQTEHTKACEDMEKLSPSQLAEMKQRMPQAVSTR